MAQIFQTITQLREEVLQMQSVDFKKYADIIVNLQMKNKFYFLIKEFDEETLDHIRSRFDMENGLEFTAGDMSILPKLTELKNFEGAGDPWEQCEEGLQSKWSTPVFWAGSNIPFLIDSFADHEHRYTFDSASAF